MWEIEATDEFSAWYAGLNEPEYSAVNADRLYEAYLAELREENLL